ncbi:MAG: RteC domain-containing protein [Ginsengibacter sp.]
MKNQRKKVLVLVQSGLTGGVILSLFLKDSKMDNKWSMLYEEMLEDIEKCWKLQMPEPEQLECAFKIATGYWYKLKQTLHEHVFNTPDDEIAFYKYIKPKFTSHIEYLTLVNHALLFIPKQKDFQLEYWEYEAERLERFTEKNKAFVEYYTKQSNQHDLQYFLPANYDLANYIVSKPYEVDGEFMTSHDHLVASFLAQQMYHEYVGKKLIIDNE